MHCFAHPSWRTMVPSVLCVREKAMLSVTSIVRATVWMLLLGFAYSLALAATPQIAQRYTHALALRSDGAAFAWGSDGFGQIGIDREAVIASPRQVPGLPPIAKVSGGTLHALALGRDGFVYSWGDSLFGQLGERREFENWRPGRVLNLDSVQDIAAGTSFSAALRRDGTVRVWGFSLFGAGVAVPVPSDTGLRNVRAIAAGAEHLLMLDGSGRVIAVGANDAAQLGQGTTSPLSGFRIVPVANATLIRATGAASAVLDSAGRVYWWGRLSFDARNPAFAVRQVSGFPAPVVDIHLSQEFGYARLSNGQLWRWNDADQVTQVAGIADAQAHTALRLSNQETIAVLGAGGQLRTTGYNGAGQLAIGNTATTAGVLSPVGQIFAQISAGGQFMLATRADGSVWMWGASINGETGTSTVLSHPVPRRVPNLPTNVIQVSVGETASYALDSGGFTWAWGDNSFGQHGDGSFSRKSRPTRITNIDNVTQIAAGLSFIAYLRSNGTVWSAGSSLAGVSPAPYQIPGLPPIRKIASGTSTIYMISTTGQLWAYGNNNVGQLGNGTNNESSVAVRVNIPASAGQVLDVVGGDAHAIAITADRSVWLWGRNSYGQTGDTILSAPSLDYYPTPTALTRSGFTPTAIAAGADTSFVVYNDGAAFVAGNNNLGQLGGGQNTNAYYDSFVRNTNLDGARAISAGFLVALAMAPDGTALGWGANARSGITETIGDGTYNIRYEPSIVRAQDGSGTLEDANWFLDLDLTQANVIQPIRIPGLLTVSQLYGGNASTSLEAVIQYRQRDQGKNVNNYAVGLVPRQFLDLVDFGKSPEERVEAMRAAHQQLEERKAAAKAGRPDRLMANVTADSDLVLVQLTPSGWQVVTGQLTSLTTNVIQGNSSAQRILNNINLNLIPGAQFCVGYGTDANAMLTEGNLAEVLTIPGASGTSGGLPCLRSGAYLQGPERSRAGETVRFNVTVVGIAPTGNVTLRNGAAGLRTLPLPGSGGTQAVRSVAFDVAGLPTGRNVITAAYAGDGASNPAANSAALNHDVQAAPTVAISGPAASTLGESVTFTATLTGGANAGGTIQFLDGGLSLGPAQMLVNGRASLTTSTLIAGGHTIIAVYSGDAANAQTQSVGYAHTVSAPNLDTTPDAFSFAARTGVDRNTVVTSEPITLRGINAPTTVTVSGGEYSVGCTTDYTTGASTIIEGQIICARHVSSTLGTTQTTTTVSVGGVSGTFSSTTAAIVIDPSLPPNEDFDGDGIPNGVEAALGTNPRARDNNIFANAQLFAMQQFRDFLGREGDSAGVSFWTNQLTVGARTRAQMVEDYFNSGEFQSQVSPVVRLYFAYFNRIPDSDGLLFWIGQRKAGNSLNDISNAFAGSAEFVATYGNLTNGDFVNRVYQNVLGRPADAAGLQFWTSQLNSGATTRGNLMAQFSESAEYQNAKASETYVISIYVGMLRRSPDPGGYNFWVGERRAGRGGLSLIEGFLGSGEYRQRFL